MSARAPESTTDSFGLSPDTVERVARSADEGVCWTGATADFDLNLVAWSAPHGVAAHVNSSLDVLVVGLYGEGTIEIDERSIPLARGGFQLIPRGSRRAIRARTRLVYLTCHHSRSRSFSSEELFGARADRPG